MDSADIHAAHPRTFSCDAAGKMMVVKNSEGKEHTIYWNETTKTAGDEMKEAYATGRGRVVRTSLLAGMVSVTVAPLSSTVAASFSV